MARRRYQTGTIEKKGTREPKWFLRYNEYCIQDGATVKIQRSKLIGLVRDLPTEKTAKRAAASLLDEINASALRPKNLITFAEFAVKWKQSVLPNHKPSSQCSEAAHLTRLLVDFGATSLSEFSVEKIQRWITMQKMAPKTVRNYVATLRTMWRSAKAWGYVQHNPFEDLIMPARGLVEKPCLAPEQAREIIRKADEPFKTMFWVVAETGMRGGEVCGLFTDDVDLVNCMIHVRRSAWRGNLQTPKTGNAVRTFPISSSLAAHLKQFICGGAVATPVSSACGGELGTHIVKMRRPERLAVIESNPQRLLFPNLAGNAYDNGNVVTLIFKPLLESIGITRHFRMGLHAFRHGSASVLDSIQAPMKVRQERLGHGSAEMTMRYTHAASDDHRKVADALGKMFDPSHGQDNSLGQDIHEVRGEVVQPSTSDSGVTGADAVRLGVGVVSGGLASIKAVRKTDELTLANGSGLTNAEDQGRLYRSLEIRNFRRTR